MADVCLNCGSKDRIKKEKGPHTGEYCSDCGKWIRWIPKPWQEFVWPVGSTHKGKLLSNIVRHDRRYLIWASENLKGNLKERAVEALNATK